MKKNLRVSALLLSLAMAATACGQTPSPETPETVPPAQEQEQAPHQYDAAQQAFMDKVDVSYSYNLALKLGEFKDNETLGYRTAGSPAELAAGDFLKEEMERIGLSNVSKDEFTLDTWTFEKANLTYTGADGSPKTIVLGGYQANLDTHGEKEFSLVYAGQGTAAELEGLDVSGKLVLVDINQRDNWWINYPAYQAHLKGAAAVLAMQDGGYSEISPDALNAQDICGPADAPALSISQTDAAPLKELLAASPSGEISVVLDAKSTVGFDGKSYNIVGMIPGRNPEQMVLMSAHYDAYFDGFQDDSAAIALMMGIAKGLVDSGYQPEKTLVFCAMAAEEWGVSNTRYDWSTGAYNQIFRVHPEWAGKTVANINFELPAYDLGFDKASVRTSYEQKDFMEAFASTLPSVGSVFPNGTEVIVPTQTWSDDFSMSIAGVPACVNTLRDEFAQQYYHTQLDNKDTYNEDVFRFHHYMYGMLMQEYDRCAVAPLNFATRMDALEDSIDQELLAAYQVSADSLFSNLDTVRKTAQDIYAQISQANADYKAALLAGDQAAADKILADNAGLNAKALASFKLAEDHFVRLTWEDSSIFPHEHAQNNLLNLRGAIAALEAGDASKALDEYLFGVDNNWYAYDWDREVFDYFTSYVLDQPADRLMWGAGRVIGHEDLFDVIKSLQTKVNSGETDFSAELEALKAAESNQAVLLSQLIEEETASLASLQDSLSA